MKRNRLPNRDKDKVYAATLHSLVGWGLSHEDALEVIDKGNPSLQDRLCRFIAADPLYRKVGLCVECFNRAFVRWIAYKAGVVASMSDFVEEMFPVGEEYDNEED